MTGDDYAEERLVEISPPKVNRFLEFAMTDAYDLVAIGSDPPEDNAALLVRIYPAITAEDNLRHFP
jgi:hypothetical protein